MKPVQRSEILTLGEYESRRPRIQKRIFAVKARRRVTLPPNLSIVFENHDTVLYQIQEMLRAERIVKARAIAHEIRTYNELVPRKDELRATLFVEIPDLHKLRHELDKFVGLPSGKHLWIESGGVRVQAAFDTSQYTEKRVSAVQYLTFAFSQEAAAAISKRGAEAELVCDHPANPARVKLSPSLRRELASDLTDRAVPRRV